MAESKRKPRTVNKSKSVENFTLRLDPKLKYLSELAARSQRRSLTSYIEATLHNALNDATAIDSDNYSDRVTFDDLQDTLWDIEESDRFVKLAFTLPRLLTYDEQALWKLITENGAVWKSRTETNWQKKEDNFDYQALRQHWETFKSVAEGDTDKNTLPKWEANFIPTIQPADPFGDDIPF